MKHTRHHASLKMLAANALLLSAILLMAAQAQAQTVYRVVGPDGRISFSDKPPAASANSSATTAGGRPVEGGPGGALPFELRQVVGKYPVTLYTSSNCVPCGSGRALLTNRGIPFAEKTVNSNEDAEALQRMSGESSLPFLTIGGQQLKGYSDAEWHQFLDAAGYPKSSLLPAGYRNPAAAPLVVVQKPVPAAKADDSQPKRTPAAPSKAPVDNASNPAGIQF